MAVVRSVASEWTSSGVLMEQSMRALSNLFENILQLGIGRGGRGMSSIGLRFMVIRTGRWSD